MRHGPAGKIQYELSQLPLEKQGVVLEFIASLRTPPPDTHQSALPRSLREHPAFGTWRNRGVDALDYQQSLRAEWEGIRVPYAL